MFINSISFDFYLVYTKILEKDNQWGIYEKNFVFNWIALYINKYFCQMCFFNRDSCPTTVCPAGTFMGDDGQCYGCEETEKIFVSCIGKEKAAEICPNRIVTWACQATSTLCPQNNCPEGMIMDDSGQCHDCDEDAKIQVNCIKRDLLNQICPNRGITPAECPEGVYSYNCGSNYKNRDGNCCSGNDCWAWLCTDF